jgi:membrane-bound inhibitor of C-type lysozyme
MKNAATAATALALATILNGCSGSWWPFGRSSGGEANRIPAGATEYTCADGKRLLVRFASDAKSAWVFLPEREFRLDESGSGERFSNGVTTLSLTGDTASLDSEGTRQLTDCKRKSS